MTSTLLPPAESQQATEATEAQHVAPPPGDWDDASWRDRLNLRKIVAPESVTPLAILFGLNAADELDRTAFAVLTPEIKRAFGLSLSGVLAIAGFVLIVNLILELPIAWVADRRNRVRIATIGAFTWGVFGALTGLSIAITSVGLLYAARLGSSLARNLNTTHRSLLSDYYPIESRARVFYAHSFANNIGQIFGPLIAGTLGALFGASVPFLLLSIPTFALVFAAAGKLREPKRGVYERLAAGADADTAQVEEQPASFAETFRTLFNNRSSRRIYYSLPFITVSAIGLGSIISLFYDEVYHVGPFQRGLISVVGEMMQIAGVAFGFTRVQRLMTRNPGRVMQLLAVAAIFYACCICGIAFSFNVWMAIAFQAAGAGANAVLTPGILAVMSLAVPPRMRSLGFATGSVWILLGAPFIFIVGGIGDHFGLRWGLVLFLPIYLIGSFLISSSGNFLNDDIRKIQVSARTMSEARKRRLDGDPQMLIVRGLDAGYDQTQVLFDVDFEVKDGDIIALLGTNGAGKSTLLKAISGIVQPQGGAIIFDGEDVTNTTPDQIVLKGIVQVPGGRGVFPGLTVAENLRIAGWVYRRDSAHIAAATEQVLGYFPVLRTRWDQPAGNLSGGEQQMLTLGMAFVAKPKLLMIDELSLGLAPIIVEQLLGIVRAIRDQGTTIILVEQSVNVALTIAETAYFMEKGEIRFRGPTTDLLSRPDILRSVFLEGAGSFDGNGSQATAKATVPATAARAIAVDAAPKLQVRHLTKRYGGLTAVKDVSFDVPDGGIVGFIGANGAGKTTLFDLVSGFVEADEGQVVVCGWDVTRLGADGRARLGLGRSFQDARLFPGLTVWETIAAALERQIDVRDPIACALALPAAKRSERAVNARVGELLDVMQLGAFRNKFISELSTGTRRIVDLACVLAHDPQVLLFDEPSSGIAQRETEALGPLLLRIRESTGASLLVIEHDMPLITSIADKIIALELGGVIAEGEAAEVVRDPKVVASYLGASEEVIARSGVIERTPRRRTRRRTSSISAGRN